MKNYDHEEKNEEHPISNKANARGNSSLYPEGITNLDIMNYEFKYLTMLLKMTVMKIHYQLKKIFIQMVLLRGDFFFSFCCNLSFC